MTGLRLGQSSVDSAHGSLQPRQLVYGVLLVRFIFGLGGGGDQADKANEKYSIDKLMRLQRAMMSGINGGLLRSAFKKSKKNFKIILTSMYHAS